MNTRFLTLAFSIVFLSMTVLLGSCTKEGPAGADGNANVTTIIDSVETSEWAVYSTGCYFKLFTVPEITDADKDLVLVYARFSPTGFWKALPASDLYYDGDNWQYQYNDGKVTVINCYSSKFPITSSFKIVVAPPTN